MQQTSRHLHDEEYLRQPPRRLRERVAPFSFGRLYGGERGTLQNMLLKGVNAPADIDPATHACASVWSDHSHATWEAARDGVRSAQSGDAWWNGVSGDDLKGFAHRVADAIGVVHPVTGARVVRFTDLSSGYPSLRLDIIYKLDAA